HGPAVDEPAARPGAGRDAPGRDAHGPDPARGPAAGGGRRAGARDAVARPVPRRRRGHAGIGRAGAAQARSGDRWLLRLWLECLAQASRDEQFREHAATFWRGNRARGEKLISVAVPRHAERAKAIASAMIALDIGVAIQHLVDPDDAPLDLYPELYA